MTESEGHSPEIPSDPSGIDEPHDILAAEEFGIGTRDERYPADPSGIQEPHDVLAAEEFPMPAGADGGGEDAERGGFDPRLLGPLALLVATLALILLRRKR
jgi:hypothetical protein